MRKSQRQEVQEAVCVRERGGDGGGRECSLELEKPIRA